MALAFISDFPTAESHHGHHLLTFKSGGEEIQLLLSLHALVGTIQVCGQSFASACEEQGQGGAEIFAFRRKGSE